ncbi:MAG: single-stranded-DNA-specific exonuclease RecJ [Bacteroidota bacterium]|nr:single-stranded-DNA-specific exonuclease RecJ [Bacteroidota bacterium]
MSIKKRWIAKPKPCDTVMAKLQDEVNTNDLLLMLMAQRNVTCLSEAEQYFLPTLKSLSSPFLMKDMDKAVERIGRAIHDKEHILVYGDYDVDGTTSVALFYSFLMSFPAKVSFYIPDRFKEGYGISYQAIDWAAEQDIKLVIALDCGIKSLSHIDKANDMGIDFIICDHHTCGDEIPKAVAVLNPKRKDCDYPYKELSGCGIGFKLAEAFAEYSKLDWDPESYLDLVAVSIASDIVPVTGENRILAHYGLNKINSTPRAGLKALMEVAGVKKNMSISDLVFKIGPRINAAGRIAQGKFAVQMLIEKDIHKAKEYAQGIDVTNKERQSYDKDTTEEALGMIAESETLINSKTTVLFNGNWHKGVIGIVASRLIEKYYKPTILLTESNGLAVGSGRSVQGYDLYQALSQCTDLIEQWGGHQAAAGLSIRMDKLEEFKARFEEVVCASITEDQLAPVQEYDLEIPLSAITPSFCKSLERFGPFGPQNMRPVFVSRGVKCAFAPRIVGNNHLQLTLTNGEPQKQPKYAIGFGMGEYFEALNRGKAFDICYCIEGDMFRDNYSAKLHLKEISF